MSTKFCSISFSLDLAVALLLCLASLLLVSSRGQRGLLGLVVGSRFPFLLRERRDRAFSSWGRSRKAGGMAS